MVQMCPMQTNSNTASLWTNQYWAGARWSWGWGKGLVVGTVVGSTTACRDTCLW